MSCKVYVDNTNLITLSGLQSAIDDSYINDATVTVTVKDAEGDEVSGQDWPAAMDYVAGSNGNYRGALSEALELVAGAAYIAYVLADAGPGRIGSYQFNFKAETRHGS